jgi:hypothetical protein
MYIEKPEVELSEDPLRKQKMPTAVVCHFGDVSSWLFLLLETILLEEA